MSIDGKMQSVLHLACANTITPFETISALIDIGGKELVFMTDDFGFYTALHYACENKNISPHVIV